MDGNPTHVSGGAGAPALVSSPAGAAHSAPIDIESLCINVIRGIAMDAPQLAGCGHPGTAMALAPLAHVLWTKIMRYDPDDPAWPDRDRFVLSCGHASILLYAMLHLTGYGLTRDDLAHFRQWGSKTPGHPEVHMTAGVEVTTGPLGQGIANAVGLAIAERMLRSRFGAEVCDHRVFAICSDGDFMEGISHEAASLAGHLGLGRLVALYDDNHITIDGPTELAYSDNVPGRFRAYGWRVVELGEAANDTAALETALRDATAADDAPTLLVLRSHIGWPSPDKTDTSAAHGEPLGADEVRRTKEILGLPADQELWVPGEVLAHYREATARGRELRAAWLSRRDGLAADRRAAYDACMSGQPAAGFAGALPAFETGAKIATRKALQACIDATAAHLPALVCGSADLTGNTGVRMPGAERQSPEHPDGRQLAFGIREHAMGAVMNAMALHGGVLPVGGTFFIFSDYMRPAVRLAALSGAHVIHSWTHDSVGLGEDGPTHQPVEHLASLRAMPGLTVIRPADAVECAQAWSIAVQRPGPVALVLSRQALPVLAGTQEHATTGVQRGAYVLADAPAGGAPDIVLIGTGSEVQVCLAAQAQLAQQGTAARVVSLPSWEIFAEQDPAYRAEVLPPGVPRLAVEAAASFGWERYAERVVAIDRFGASAPGATVLTELGINPDHVAGEAVALLAARANGAHQGGA